MAALNADQVNRYLEAAKEHRLYAAFLLELTTGLRRGELLALSWDCTDLVRGTLAVKRSLSRVYLVDEGRSELQFNEPKTESGKRTIPLLPETVQELKSHRKRQAEEKLFFGPAYQDNNLVFCTPLGTPVDPRNFHRWHTEILKKAGLPHVRVHDLRHSFASLLADAGEDPETLRALLGHSRTSTTMDLYCHANEAGKRRAINRLAGIIKA
jgi:integrase